MSQRFTKTKSDSKYESSVHLSSEEEVILLLNHARQKAEQKIRQDSIQEDNKEKEVEQSVKDSIPRRMQMLEVQDPFHRMNVVLPSEEKWEQLRSRLMDAYRMSQEGRLVSDSGTSKGFLQKNARWVIGFMAAAAAVSSAAFVVKYFDSIVEWCEGLVMSTGTVFHVFAPMLKVISGFFGFGG